MFRIDLFDYTVMILSFRTERSEQTVQTQIRLKEQSDYDLHCLCIPSASFGRITLWWSHLVQIVWCPIFLEFYGKTYPLWRTMSRKNTLKKAKKWTCSWLIRYMSRLTTKQTKWHVRPAKTRISLSIRTVWSESSQCTWGNLKSLPTHGVPRLIRLRWAHMSFCWFCRVLAHIVA